MGAPVRAPTDPLSKPGMQLDASKIHVRQQNTARAHPSSDPSSAFSIKPVRAPEEYQHTNPLECVPPHTPLCHIEMQANGPPCNAGRQDAATSMPCVYAMKQGS